MNQQQTIVVRRALAGLVLLGLTGCDDDINPKRLTKSVFVRVVDSRSGRPLAGTRLINQMWGEYGSAAVAHAETDARGEARIAYDPVSPWTLRVAPKDHATSIFTDLKAESLTVRTDPLPPDHKAVVSGCIEFQTDSTRRVANRFRLPLEGELRGTKAMRIQPDGKLTDDTADLVVTWPVGRDSSLGFEARGQGGLVFVPASDSPDPVDMFALTCEAPESGWVQHVEAPQDGSDGMLILRTRDGARYAKIKLEGRMLMIRHYWAMHSQVNRIWYNPSGGRGLCNSHPECGDE